MLPAELQKTLVKFKGLEIMLFTSTAYTKHEDINDQESFRKSVFLYSALQSPIQYCVVTAIMCVVRLSPEGRHRFPSVHRSLALLDGVDIWMGDHLDKNTLCCTPRKVRLA